MPPLAPAWAVYVALVVVSFVHNEIVTLVHERTDGRNPWTAFFVVFGVSYTIGAAYLIDGDAISVWTLFFCFVASGTPMILGDMIRYYQRNR